MTQSSNLNTAASLFDSLGFVVQPIKRDEVLFDKNLRRQLTLEHAESEVSRLLRNLPDLFVLNPRLDPALAALFVVVTDPEMELEQERINVAREYWPEESIELRLSTKNGQRMPQIRWISEDSPEYHPFAVLFEVLEFQPQKSVLKHLSESNWII